MPKYFISLRFFFCITIVCSLAISCNPAKRVAQNEKAYQALIDDYIQKHPPRVDSSVELIPGGTDTVFQSVLVIDTTAVKIVRDSLQTALHDKEKDCSREINEAFKTGYAQALYLAGKTKIAQPRPDTIIKKIFPTDYINNINAQLAAANILLTVKDGIIKVKSKWFWFFLLSVAVNLVLLFITVKSVQHKTII